MLVKPGVSKRKNQGLTLVEVAVVIVSLFLVALALLPALSAPRLRTALNCANQLKSMGVAFRVWEGDHNGKYPMDLSVTNGGVMELALEGNAEAVFQVMSNELANPKILVCPADKTRLPVATFQFKLAPKNVSYFVGLEAKPDDPQSILSGDDNFETRGGRAKSGVLEIATNTPIAWTGARHRYFGYLAFSDGSVLGVRNGELGNYSHSTNAPLARLAIP